MELHLERGGFQDRFFSSCARFPAMIAGVATGKTLLLLMKIWQFCETYPRALGLIVRKEYTDLRDSTLRDFTRYFGLEPNADKEARLTNKSVVMFRHGAEINVLKNITLDIAGIEQAEEFETEEQFEFLRDRLRGTAGPRQQLCLVANAQAHNWIWQRWINNLAVDGAATSIPLCRPLSPDYETSLAHSFDNAQHLPPDYVHDLRVRELEEPAHFAQYVMNRFDVAVSTDCLLSAELLHRSVELSLLESGAARRVLGVDVARFGGDEIVYSLLESRGPVAWEQTHQETHKHQGVDQTVGQLSALCREWQLDLVVVDEVGVGGMMDVIASHGARVIGFNGGESSLDPRYARLNDVAAFLVQEKLQQGWLKLLPDPILHEQMLAQRFRYQPDGRRYLISKAHLRAETGRPSPDRWDALKMAVWGCDQVGLPWSGHEERYEAALDALPSNGGYGFR